MEKFYTGFIPDIEDDRDFVFNVPSEPFDWEMGFDIELVLGFRKICKDQKDFFGKRGRDGWGVERYKEIKELNPDPFKIPVKNQHRTSSCTAQAMATYISVLNMIETGKWVEISPRDIYSYIHLPNGGAMLRTAIALSKNRGIATLDIVPVTVGDRYMTESEIIKKPTETDIINFIRKTFQSKSYAFSNATMDNFAWEMLLNFGCFSGVRGSNNGTWKKEYPTPPSKVDWGHAIFYGKAGIYDKQKTIRHINSWGENTGVNGWQGLRQNYFDAKAVFPAWTLTDKKNIIKNKFMFVKEKGINDVYFLGADNKLHPIVNEIAFKELFGSFDKVVEVEKLEQEIGDMVGLIKR